MTTSKKRNAELLAELDALRKRIESFEAKRKETDEVEEMMWETQVALATLIDNLPGIAYRTAYDEKGKPHVVFVSAGCRTVAEQETADFIADPNLYPDVIVHPDDRDRVKKAIVEAVADRKPYDLTYRIRTPNGVDKWVSERGFGLFGEDGRLMAREGFISDITDRVRPLELARMECERLRDRLDESLLELRIVKAKSGQRTDLPLPETTGQSQLMRSQRFETLGTLAGGIAHDFNNLLQAIIGYAKLAGESNAPCERIHTYLQRILEASTRARQLVAQILTFCKQAEQEPSPQNLQSLVEEGVRMLRASLPATIDVTTILEGTKAMAVVDPTRFSQVFITLCANACRQLLVDGGNLDISLNITREAPDAQTSQPGPDKGPYGAIRVCARPAEHEGETRIPAPPPFEGIGLSVLEDIARHQGGTIVSDENPPSEYSHTLYLPVTPAPGTAAKAALGQAMVELPEGGGEHILFVDDEEMLVELGELVAEDLGYRVTACTSSVEALRAFEADPAAFDLVITDQTMPHMTGFELAGKMLAIRPDIPIILTTGYSEVVNELQARAIGIREYLMKPITPENLAEAIRRVLDGTDEN